MPILAAFLAALGPWVSRLIALDGALWVVKILSGLGIAFVTHEAVIQPALDLISTGMDGAPAALRVWLGAFGFDQGLSLIVSAYVVSMTKRTFLRMRKPGA